MEINGGCKWHRLAKREENVMIEEFGEEYLNYMESTPAFIPSLKRVNKAT
jgi:protein-S-isoprenylcysteine O-methyltransferase Ste14